MHRHKMRRSAFGRFRSCSLTAMAFTSMMLSGKPSRQHCEPRIRSNITPTGDLAYRYFMTELRGAPASDLWRYTADLLYLLENPVVREAFFPSSGQEYAVEPARIEDGQAILDIIDASRECGHRQLI